MTPIRTELRSRPCLLAPFLVLGLLLGGCTGKGDAGSSGDDGPSGASTGGWDSDGSPTSSASVGSCTDGPGATSSYTSGYDPCGGTWGCWPTTDPTGWTSDPTDSEGTVTTTGDEGPGTLITTGNEDATEWDVTVRHTFTGRPPEEGTYLATTIIHMDSDFYSVVAIPDPKGGTWYGYFDGDYADGMVTIVDGSVAVPDVAVEGTLQITDVTLDGSGTFHDADTDALMGTWEILSATPLP